MYRGVPLDSLTSELAQGTIQLLAALGVEWWAHQDSNLERAGYEPAALTVELWARPTVYFSPPSPPAASARQSATRFVLRGTRAACGFARDDGAWGAPSPPYAGSVR